jgi:hypothetical protein
LADSVEYGRDPKPIRTAVSILAVAAGLFGLGWELLNSHPIPALGLMVFSVVYLIYELATSRAFVDSVPPMLRFLAVVMVLCVLAGICIPRFQHPVITTGKADKDNTENSRIPPESTGQEPSTEEPSHSKPPVSPSSASIRIGTVRKDAIALGDEIHRWVDEQINNRDKQQKKDEDTEALAARFGPQAGKDYQGKFGLKIAKMLAKLRKCEADVSKLEAAVSDSNTSPTFRIPEVLYSVVSALPEAANSIPDGKPECGTGAPSEGFKRKHTGMFTVVSGDNSFGFWEEQLESGIELPEGGLSKFKFYKAVDGVIYVDATLYLAGGEPQSSGTIGEPDVVIRKNQVTISQMLPLWDEQVSGDTIEIVNNNRVAVFRLVFDRDANKVTINAVYRNKSGPIGDVKGFKPMFRYPSHTYKGEIAN